MKLSMTPQNDMEALPATPVSEFSLIAPEFLGLFNALMRMFLVAAVFLSLALDDIYDWYIKKKA